MQQLLDLGLLVLVDDGPLLVLAQLGLLRHRVIQKPTPLLQLLLEQLLEHAQKGGRLGLV